MSVTLPRKRTTNKARDLDDLSRQTFEVESDTYSFLGHLQRQIAELFKRTVSPLTAHLDCGAFNVTNAGLIHGAPMAFAWDGGVATVDVSARNDFAASNTLTVNSVLTLIGGIDGCQGTIYVKQDGTGSRTLSFTVSGRTVLREESAADSNPQAGANALTGYSYDYKTIAGTAYVIVERFKLT